VSNAQLWSVGPQLETLNLRGHSAIRNPRSALEISDGTRRNPGIRIVLVVVVVVVLGLARFLTPQPVPTFLRRWSEFRTRIIRRNPTKPTSPGGTPVSPGTLVGVADQSPFWIPTRRRRNE
jgi:hypothetical protein